MRGTMASSAVESLGAVFRGPASIGLARSAIAAPGPGEVLVRLEGCGVCASNLPVWEGRPWFHYPLAPGAPGHEGWGRIEALGEAVEGLRVGDRVACLSQRAYAQYDVAASDAVVRLPESLAAQPFPGEPLGCVVNVFRRARIEAGQTVAIVGIGFLGAALTALATRAGAHVLALSRRTFALELAERYGARHLIRLEEPARAVQAARAIVGEHGCERVIEAVGNQEALDVASELTGTRGRLVIAGYHQDGPRQVNVQQWNWRGIDVVNAHERDPAVYRRGMQEAVELVDRGELDPAPLYTHRFALGELPAAFAMLAARPEGFLKALVDCS